MINFLTSNAKKAEDFKFFGFGVTEFHKDIPEIKSPNVEEVALYKAKDTELNNIVVEDTSLHVEGSHFWGTDIKHVYEEIKEDPQYNNHEAIWKISLCMKKDDFFYIASGELKGKLSYPAIDKGYHFERFFSVEVNGEYVYYPKLKTELRNELSPRFQALKKLEKAIRNGDYSDLIKIPEKEVDLWSGEYQVEQKVKNKITP